MTCWGSFTLTRTSSSAQPVQHLQGATASRALEGMIPFLSSQDLGVNSLEQLCINFANEHLQWFFSQTVIAQEEVSRTQRNSHHLKAARVE